LAADAPAAAAPAGGRSTVKVMGEATISRPPDLAEVDLGVVSQARTAAAAAQENAAKLDRVLKALREAVGAKGEISTIAYTVMPQGRPTDRGPLTIESHVVSNTLRVRLRDLALVGRVVDLALGRGANEVQRLVFTLQNESQAQGEALRAAATNARTEASALAAALGLRIVRILAVEEAGGGPRPFFAEMARMKADAVATPIQPGAVEVQATVSLTYEVAPSP
jgi:hypothetical protein